MKYNKKRVSKIVDELMTYLFTKGATNINVNVQEEESQFIISIKSNFTKFTKKEIKRLVSRLNIERQEEMEEYYWELTGESDIDTQISLVGMMTDKGEVKFLDNNTIEIVLYRYK